MDSRFCLFVQVLTVSLGAIAVTACGSPPPTPAPTTAALPTAAAATALSPTAATAATASSSPTAKPTAVPKENEVSFQNGDLQLRGFIWKPEGNGPFPALLWNHGSEKLPGWLPDLGPVFVSQGYVFLVPHRRGQGRSSGTYIQDALDKITNIGEKSKMLVQLHDTEQFSDQVAGLKYLQGLAYVDRSKIAVAGCSYGGIQTLIAAEKNPGYRAAVDFAGGAMSWKSAPDLQVRLRTAARNLAVPTFFIQAENDFDLSPTKELPIEAQNAGKPFKAQIYPPSGTTNQDGHDFCVKGISVWGKDVFPFLSASMK